jgi:hypothetical protein
VWQSQITQQQAVSTIGAVLHTIPYDGGESTSIHPAPPRQGTSLTTATVPRRSIANRHVNRRLNMCDNRKLRSSKLFDRWGPSYAPYHMMVESRPLYLLLRLVRAPLWLQQQYHADPLLTGTSIVVYICVPIVNQAAASCLIGGGLSTHHTIWWRRVDLYTSCFASSEPPFDCNNATLMLILCVPRQSSSKYVSQTQLIVYLYLICSLHNYRRINWFEMLADHLFWLCALFFVFCVWYVFCALYLIPSK